MWSELITFDGHIDRVESVQLKIYNAVGKVTGRILSSSRDMTIKYWNIKR